MTIVSVSLYCVSAFILVSPLLGSSEGSFRQNPEAQSQSPATSRPTRHDTTEVTARLSPEEVEEGKLNDLYQPVSALERSSQCTVEVIRRFQVDVVPVAAKSRFNLPKSKFLFLADRDIGQCYSELQKFPEAEISFEEAMKYVSVWPGTDDSGYPILFRQIATAQIGQQRWTDAEQSLLKSVALFDPQIAAGEKADAQLNAHLTRNYRGSQSRSYALLAVVYLREGRTHDSLNTVEKAYREVTKYDLDASYYNGVVDIGKRVADASGDASAKETWSKRNPK